MNKHAISDQLSLLRFARARFNLRLRRVVDLPPYLGGTLRGAIGYGLKATVCVQEHGNCDACLVRERCAYPYLFETPIPKDAKRLGSLERAPHPFVVVPPLVTRREDGDATLVSFDLVLFGAAIEHLPFFVLALDRVGSSGGLGGSGHYLAETARGETGGRLSGPRDFVVESVEDRGTASQSSVVYVQSEPARCGALMVTTITDLRQADCTERVGLRFLTPLRVNRERRLASRPEFDVVMRNLLRRISNLAYFHCGAEVDLPYRDIIDAAREVRLVEDRTRWWELERYSTRQKRAVKMGGIIGTAVYQGSVSSFGPLLALGSAIHIGKGTTMGLGRFEVMP